MSYFSHLYRCRLGARKRNGWKPLVEKYGELKAIIFEKLYKESNEWDDLRNITQNTLEARRKQNMAKLIKKSGRKMEAKNHILVGLFSLGIVYWAITVLLKRIIETPTLLGMAAAAIAFSILPDVDQKNSYASRYANYALIAVLVLSILAKRQAYAILAALGLAFLNIITHRTYVHSLLFGAIVALPLLEFGMFVAAAGFAAFLSHLIVDGEVSFFAEKDWW